MSAPNHAIQAYRAASGYKSQRDVEADMFREVINALRAAQFADFIQQVKAVADNRRLWLAVQAVISDPGNVLPAELRAGIASLNLAMQRAMHNETPDLDFLISVNEAVLAGLTA